jgi:hypothetical protein
VYPFATERYEPEGKSKIDLACEMIRAVPMSKHPTYVLMDSWYPSSSVLQTSAEQGFHVISGLKTNRIFYPQGIRQSMKAFLSTDVSLTNEMILSYYSKRWAIETYFRTAKVHLAMDRYQVRSTQAIDRYLTLLMFASMCCIYDENGSLIDGLHHYRSQKKQGLIEYIYYHAQSGATLAQIKTQLRAA